MKKRTAAAATLCLAFLLSGCAAVGSSGGDSAGTDTESIVVAGFGGTFTDVQRTAYYEPFTAETGIQIVEADTGIAALQSQVDTGNVQWDAAMMSTTDLGLGSAKGLFESLDGVVDPADFLDDTVTEFGIGLDLSSNVMAWNSEDFSGDEPESWEDFWDLEKFPGKRAVPSWGPDAQLFEFALLADGVPADELYPLDVDRALAKLDEIRESFVVFDSNAQGLQLVTGGQAAFGVLPNGRVELAARSSMPIDFTFNEGALATDWIVIPKGAPNAEAAKEFIRFATAVPQQQEFLKQIPYAGTNKGALEGLSASVIETLPTGPSARDIQFRPDSEYYAENATMLMESWQSFLYG